MDMNPIADKLIKAFNDGYEHGYEDARLDLKGELECCRNELCLRCGSYKTAHLGSCDGCRWKH